MDPMPIGLVLSDDYSTLKRGAPELMSMASTEPQTYGSREQADLRPGSIFAPSSVAAADYLDTGGLLHSETNSTPSRPTVNLVAPENRWRNYRMIEGVSLSSPQSGHNPRPRLSPETELELIEVFFQSIQPHYPLFRKSTFLGKHHAGQVQESLLSAMLAVSIANSTNIDVAGLGFSNVSETYAFHAWQVCSDIVIYGSSATMDDLKTLFLLGLYEFRNFPNRKAWNVTGHLVRQAYHYGLHQVESPGGCGFLDRKTTGSLEQEELRYFWWSLYILDTCCNLTIAIPSSIDLDMVNTYLPSGNVERWTSGYSPPIETHPMSLTADIQGLSELVTRVSHSHLNNVGALSSSDGNYDTNFLIRIITTSILRELSNVRQIAAHSSELRAQQRWQTQSNLFAALQLALPTGYLDPRRDLPSGESGYNHTLRLVSVFEINLARLWQQLPKPYDQVGSRAWLIDWCAALETTERIVDVIKQWDPGSMCLADPAISYIIFISMVLIQTDKRLDRQAIGLAVTGERSQDSWQLLKLFLQRLSSHWLLSKALLAAAENFRSAASSPLSLADAAEILKNFQKPLTFRKDRSQGETSQSETMRNTSFDQSNQDDMFWAYNLNPNILPDWFDFGNIDSFQL